MEIKIINEKTIWEDFVKEQKYTSLFQSWNWGEFERSMGNKFENFGIFDEEKLIGLIPIKHVSAIRGKYLHIRHGPIFDFKDKNIWNEFYEFILKKAKNEGYWFVRMSPLITKDFRFKEIEIFNRLKKSPMHDVDAEITWVLNLDQTEQRILSNMRKNTRYYIKRAERDGVKIIKTTDSKYLKNFWTIYSDTVKRQKWSAYSCGYIKNEFEIFKKDKQIELYLAEYKNKFIAASLILYYGNQAIYHHSGSLTKYSKVSASYLIQWEAIKEAKKRGLRWYNFWGISPLEKRDGKLEAKKKHPWEGLTFFKMGFGGEVRQFIHARDLPIRKIYYLTRLFESLEKRSRRY